MPPFCIINVKASGWYMSEANTVSGLPGFPDGMFPKSPHSHRWSCHAAQYANGLGHMNESALMMPSSKCRRHGPFHCEPPPVKFVGLVGETASVLPVPMLPLMVA